MNAIEKAISESARSYTSAKAAVSNGTADVLAQRPAGNPFGPQNKMDSAKKQLEAFKSWVYAAIRPICNVIAAQPVTVAKPSRTPAGTKAVIEENVLENHPLARMISNPNGLMTGYGLLWATVASLNLTGRAFWWMPDESEELHLIPVSWVQRHTGRSSFETWVVRPPGKAEAINIPAEQMVYFSMPDPGNPWGSVSPLQACASAVDNDDDILCSQRSSFTRGVHPSHAIIVGKDARGDMAGGARPRLSEQQQRQLIGAIKRRYSGTHKHGEPLILDGLIEDIKALSLSPSEMDWTASADKMKERILQTYGTSPYILGGSEPGSRAASAVAMKHFVAGTVNPLIRLMNASLEEWLGRPNGVVVRIEPAIADDDEMNVRKAEVLSKNGALRVNELRKMLGLEEDASFDGQLVGGKNMHTTHPIEAGIRAMIDDAYGSFEADRVLSQIPSRNNNGQLPGE